MNENLIFGKAAVAKTVLVCPMCGGLVSLGPSDEDGSAILCPHCQHEFAYTDEIKKSIHYRGCCPYCGNEYETEELIPPRQKIQCPTCGKKFLYPENIGDAHAAQANDVAKKNKVKAICPRCGYAEDVDLCYIGDIGVCERCGHEFRIGGATRKSVMSNRISNSRMQYILSEDKTVVTERPPKYKSSVSMFSLCWKLALIVAVVSAALVGYGVYMAYNDRSNNVPILSCVSKMTGLNTLTQAGYRFVLLKYTNEKVIRCEQLKNWYINQLEYNGLKETRFHGGPKGCLISFIGDGDVFTITYQIPDFGSPVIMYPSNMTKGFVEELVMARLEIAKIQGRWNPNRLSYHYCGKYGDLK